MPASLHISKKLIYIYMRAHVHTHTYIYTYGEGILTPASTLSSKLKWYELKLPDGFPML